MENDNYQVGSLQRIFSTKADKDASNPFSEAAVQKFRRVEKPVEFLLEKEKLLKNSDSDSKSSKKKRKREENAEVVVNPENDDLNVPKTDDDELIKKKREIDLEKNERTLFVGNVPTSYSTKSLSKYFSEFGEVESIRIRSVPIAGTAVDDNGNQNLVKKVCANTKKFGEQKGSFNAYVVYKDIKSVELALVANNRVIDGRHLRVDKSTPSLFDPKLTVFVGSLSHYTDEELLRQHFAKVLPNGDDDIESIRLIRDPESLLVKGIGYILLKNRDAVLKALSLHQVAFKKRDLRVTTCGKRTKRQEIQKEDPELKEWRQQKKQKLEERQSQNPKNSFNAQKRIQSKELKSYISKRSKSKNNKNKPIKKKKQLGGVIKKAMKLAKNNGNKK